MLKPNLHIRYVPRPSYKDTCPYFIPRILDDSQLLAHHGHPHGDDPQKAQVGSCQGTCQQMIHIVYYIYILFIICIFLAISRRVQTLHLLSISPLSTRMLQATIEYVFS